MSTTQQPEELRLADALAYCDASVASQAAAELRRLHAENTTLQQGYAAARLEIESLRAQLHAAPTTQPAPQQGARPVTPYTCPKCSALWLHWPAEQSGFGRDTLNCRSTTHCDYCEKGGVEQLQRLERVPAVLAAPQQEAQEPVEIPTKCPYFGPSPHRDVWLEGWHAACATQPAGPQAAGKAVHQFRKQYCADWYDGRADHGDSGGPYEERTLYTVPQPTAQGDELDVVLDAFENKTRGIPQAHIAAALVAELRAAIDAARTTPTARVDALDAARLDWLENDVGCRVFHLGKSWYTRANFGMPYRKRASLREAIDAASAAHQEGEAP